MVEGVAERTVDHHVVRIVEAKGKPVRPLVGYEAAEAGAPAVGPRNGAKRGWLAGIGEWGMASDGLRGLSLEHYLLMLVTDR